jgi:predicted phage baseplate assembly protein
MSDWNCAGCEGTRRVTPVALKNRPGLYSIAYRAGTYGQFKASMLASLSQNQKLLGLTTRQDDDLAIALLDCWATVADVLTFYQERIANEGFLRTSKERRSIKELARTVGYELRPGVAANTYLAFSIEEAAGAVDRTEIAAGTKVQSLPGAGEKPQVFETVEDIEARPEWNRLRPRMAEEHELAASTTRFLFKGVNTRLKPGDVLLVVTPSDVEDKFDATLKVVASVEADAAAQVTVVESSDVVSATRIITLATIVAKKLMTLPRPVELDSRKKLQLIKNMAQARMTESQLRTYARALGWRKIKLAKAINFLIRLKLRYKPPIPEWTAEKLPEPQAGVYAFRARGSFFGHNAPSHASLPAELTAWGKAYHYDWDSEGGTSILRKSQGAPYPDQYVHLDNAYPSVVQNSWVVVQDASKHTVYRVAKTTERSLADFAMSSKVTGLKLSNDDLEDTDMTELDKFMVRETMAHVQSELLELADVPIEAPVEGSSIDLDRLVPDLKVGQAIAVSGETLLDGEPTGVSESEVAVISDIAHELGRTTLVLEKNLDNVYKRDTVVINANVAWATHGESKEEALGSGDPSMAMQEFTLKQKPLTFITSAKAPGGAASTLAVYVSDVLWQEAPDLNSLGPADRAYVVRIENEDGTGYGQTKVIFGDGTRGMRPPAGSNNIVARYRAGMGQEGMVKEGQLSLLATRPLGVKSVTNPVAASGAAGPEVIEHARKNAPLKLLAMGRMVSLQDFADFAQAFAGIGKAQAAWMWDGEKRVVLLTVASGGGEVVQKTSPLYRSLAGAVENSKDPAVAVLIEPFVPRFFKLVANVAVERAYLPEKVFSAVREKLLATFSFESMDFAQPVALSDVASAIQQVQGVVAVDIDSFYPAEDAAASLRQSIPARPARWEAGAPVAAELLMIDPDGITLVEMKL